ncbi:hypothetical protein SSYRP_v1c00580 [Spiroplasma syrphidicola EA-1]|uniref:Transmembrane protein n=1 Tax=Spiroplasma syrphidicola EA-1 TaxID=1276229 RepID=R4UCR3_9MOLU|nr:hypothetical protein [Spiroplasma syrphidicola]AGM25654.1 hypothetical protein SSYRP_v1c00580 [Spiroplasma syrphidicola EA-1]
MKKRYNKLLIIGSSVTLALTTVGTVTGCILRYQQNNYFNMDIPGINIDKVEENFIKAKISEPLKNDYINMVKKIYKYKNGDEIVESDKFMDLNSAIMNSVSQRLVWESASSEEVSKDIYLLKNILQQVYEYYQQVYQYQTGLDNNSLNTVRLQSINQDIYAWSVGAKLSDYNLISNYNEAALKVVQSSIELKTILDIFIKNKKNKYAELISDAINGIKEMESNIINKENVEIELQNDLNEVRNVYNESKKILDKIDLFRNITGSLYGIAVAANVLGIALVPWLGSGYAILAGLALTASLAYNVDVIAKDIILNEQVDIVRILSGGLKLGGIIALMFKKTIVQQALTQGIEIILRVLGVARLLTAKLAASIMALLGIVVLSADYFGTQLPGFEELENKFKQGSELDKNYKEMIFGLEDAIANGNKNVIEWNKKIDLYSEQKINFSKKINLLNNTQNNIDFIDSQFTQISNQNILDFSEIIKYKEFAKNKYSYLNSTTDTKIFSDLSTTLSKKIQEQRQVVDNKYNDFILNYNNTDKLFFAKNSFTKINMNINNLEMYLTKSDFDWYNYEDEFIK